jgi:hypothetical protein
MTGSPRQPAAPSDQGGGGSRNGPVILLSYVHAGALQVQELLAAGTGLACTSRTGIIPLCAAAAETWRRVEGRDGPQMSRLAAASLRGLVTAQVTTILAGAAGKTRWCELATGDPGAVPWFLQVIPSAVFVCVHRNCLDVIRAGVAASPWGLHGQGLGSYVQSYPGNSVAALAAYWADSAAGLLAFEAANPGITYRVRSEDTAAEPADSLAALRAWLRVAVVSPEALDSAGPGDGVPPVPGPEVPPELIPPSLRQHISRLHAELGYAPLPGSNAQRDNLDPTVLGI